MIQEAKCSHTCQMYSDSERGTGLNMSGQALSITGDPGFIACGQAQFYPWEEEGQPFKSPHLGQCDCDL